MTLLSKFEEYLKLYSAMDLNAVSNMFAEDVLLRDWKISVSGKQLAVDETRKNFESSESIEIEILNTYTSLNTVAGELRIIVNNTEVLYVVDVISFNEAGQIKSIKAYIGRED